MPKQPKKDQRIPIVVTNDVKEKLAIEAEKHGLSLSSLGRTLLMQWYNEQIKENKEK